MIRVLTIAGVGDRAAISPLTNARELGCEHMYKIRDAESDKDTEKELTTGAAETVMKRKTKVARTFEVRIVKERVGGWGRGV